MEAQNLNRLYAASLEFGANWRRPLDEWACELFPAMPEAEQQEIAAYIKEARAQIEEYVEAQYDKVMNKTVQESDVKQWIVQRYPWMDEENVLHAYSQGMYYAWHG